MSAITFVAENLSFAAIKDAFLGFFSGEGEGGLLSSLKSIGSDILTGINAGIKDATGIDLSSIISFDGINVEEVIGNISEAFAGISEQFGTLLPDPFGILSTVFSGISETLGFISENWDSIVQAFKVALNNPFDALSLAFTLVSTSLQAISDGYDNLADLFATLFPNPFGEALSTAAKFVSRAFEIIAEKYGVVAEFFASRLANPFDIISQTIEPILNFFDTIDEKIERFIERVTALRDNSVVNFVLGEPENADEAAQRAAEELSSSLAESGVRVDAAQLLEVDTVEVTEAGKAIATEFADSVGVGFTQAQRDRDKVIQLLNQGVTGEEIVELGNSLGLDFNAGIIAGLTTGNNGTQEARDVAAAILNAAQVQLGIESPSTQARDLIGKPIVEGILAGLTLDGTDAQSVISNTASQVISIFETSFASLSSSASGLLDSLLRINPTIITSVTSTITSVIAQFRRLQGQQVQLVTRAVNKTIDLHDEMGTDTTRIVTSWVETLLEEFRSLADNSVLEVTNMVTEILEQLERLAEDGSGFVEGFVDEVEGQIEKFSDALNEDAIPSINDLIGKLEELQRDGTTAISSFVNSSKTALLELIEVFKQAGQDAIQGLITAISNAATTVSTALNTLSSDVKEELNVGTDSSFFIASFEPVGSDIVSGLIKGMRDDEDLLIEEARRLAQIVDSSFKTESGIFSPSRVFAQNGREIVLGLAQGIDDNAVIAAQSVANLALLLTLTAQSALGIASPSKVAYSKIGTPFVDGITTALTDGNSSVALAADTLASMMSTNSLKQPVDVQYAGLLNSLNPLSQKVLANISPDGLGTMMYKIGKSNGNMLSNNSGALQRMNQNRVNSLHGSNSQINSMTRSNSVSSVNSVTNNYSMSIVTSERNATRVQSNYRRMRLKRVGT